MKKKYLLISITAHLILLGISTFYFSYNKKINEINSHSILSANLIIHPIKSLHGIHKKSFSQSAHSETNSETHCNQIPDPLIKIIYDAIATQQVYPETAQELNQAGKVKIGFWLNPDGKLSQISLLRSSGFVILDQAGLNAVKAINSIKNAAEYLKKQEYISVDIVFQI